MESKFMPSGDPMSEAKETLRSVLDNIKARYGDMAELVQILNDFTRLSGTGEGLLRNGLKDMQMASMAIEPIDRSSGGQNEMMPRAQAFFDGCLVSCFITN
jgi:hypothetical protein